MKKTGRYISAKADWYDHEFLMMAQGKRRWKEGPRGWVNGTGIFDKKKKVFAPGATVFDPWCFKRYSWLKCKNVKPRSTPKEKI